MRDPFSSSFRGAYPSPLCAATTTNLSFVCVCGYVPRGLGSVDFKTSFSVYCPFGFPHLWDIFPGQGVVLKSPPLSQSQSHCIPSPFFSRSHTYYLLVGRGQTEGFSFRFDGLSKTSQDLIRFPGKLLAIEVEGRI